MVTSQSVPLPSLITVAVQTLGGRHLQVQSDAQSSLHDLKIKIEGAWSVPTCKQRLVIGTQVFEDVDSLQAVLASVQAQCTSMSHDSPDISLTVITMEQPVEAAKIAELKSLVQGFTKARCHNARLAAARALSRCIDDGDTRQLQVVLAEIDSMLARHNSSSTRRAALESLGVLTPKGHQMSQLSLEKAMMALTDQDDFVRVTAIELVTRLATRGDGTIALTARRLLRHRNSTVRAAAVEVLGSVALKDDRLSMSAVERAFEDKDEDVRLAAADALSLVLQQH